jgi:hypothetical protein
VYEQNGEFHLVDRKTGQTVYSGKSMGEVTDFALDAGHTIKSSPGPIPNYPDVPGRYPGLGEPWTPPANLDYSGPSNHGRWVNPDGTPGTPNNSLWITTRQKIIDEVGINPRTGEANPVVFHRGKADFDPWIVGEPLTVPGLAGTKVNSNADFALIYAAVAQREGLPSPYAARKWLQKNELTPHHDGGDRVVILKWNLHTANKGGIPHTDMTH